MLTDLLSQPMDHWQASERVAEQGSSLLAEGLALAQRMVRQPTALVAGTGRFSEKIQTSPLDAVVTPRIAPGMRGARAGTGWGGSLHAQQYFCGRQAESFSVFSATCPYPHS